MDQAAGISSCCRIYTVGHSTRSLAEFEELLSCFQIKLLVDVRTVPKSRRVPHFNGESLGRSLHPHGIDYVHMKRLGGLRKPGKDSCNQGWRNLSFRGFADYMQTEEFWQGVGEVVALGKEKKLALMCAEAVPWRCHRSLIADALLVREAAVVHIISKTSSRPHMLTPFAVVRNGRITYPAA
ncbi:MAG: DUF488 domain-containing protein [Deltaproteobacteria bacterium]|nr:DUF488 domain-containing protein [Deltaproteobacteria bacterium]